MEKKYSLLVGESSHQLTKGWNIVGRSTMNDQHNTVLLDDESICPQHAVISWHENDTFKIIDLCTKSGTSINNETIKSLYWQDVPIDASIKFGSVESYLRICSEQNACLNTSVDTSDQEFVSCSPGIPMSPSDARKIRSQTRSVKSDTQSECGSAPNTPTTKAHVDEVPSSTSHLDNEDDDFFIAATQDQGNCIKPLAIPTSTNELSAVEQMFDEIDEDFCVPETQPEPHQSVETTADSLLADSDDEYIQFDTHDMNDDNSVPESQNLLPNLNHSYHPNTSNASARSCASPELMKINHLSVMTPKKADDSISFRQDDAVVTAEADDDLTDCEEELQMSDIKWADSTGEHSKSTVKNAKLSLVSNKSKDTTTASLEDDVDTDCEEELADMNKTNGGKTDLITQKSEVDKVPRNILNGLETIDVDHTTVADNIYEKDTELFVMPNAVIAKSEATTMRQPQVMIETLRSSQIVREIGAAPSTSDKDHPVTEHPLVVVEKMTCSQVHREIEADVSIPEKDKSSTSDFYNQPTQPFVMRDSQIEVVIGVAKGTIEKRKSDPNKQSANEDDIYNIQTQKFVMPNVATEKDDDIYNHPTQKFIMAPPKSKESTEGDLYNQPTQRFDMLRYKHPTSPQPSTSTAGPNVRLSKLRDSQIFREVNGIHDDSERTMSVTLDANQDGNTTNSTFIPPAHSTRMSIIDETSDCEIVEQQPTNGSPSNKENAVDNIVEEKTPDPVEVLFPKPTLSAVKRTYVRQPGAALPKNLRLTRTPSPERSMSKSPIFVGSDDENDDDFCMAATLPVDEQGGKKRKPPAKRGNQATEDRTKQMPTTSAQAIDHFAKRLLNEGTPNPKSDRFSLLSNADTPDHPDLQIIDKQKLMKAATLIKSNLAEPNKTSYFFDASSEDEDDGSKKDKAGDDLEFMVFDKEAANAEKVRANRKTKRKQSDSPEAAAATRTMKRRAVIAAEDESPPKAIKVVKKRGRPPKARAARIESTASSESEGASRSNSRKRADEQPAKEDQPSTSLGKRVPKPSPKLADNPVQPPKRLLRKENAEEPAVEEKKSKFQFKTKVQKNVEPPKIVVESPEPAISARASRKQAIKKDELVVESGKAKAGDKKSGRVAALAVPLQKNTSVDYISVGERVSRTTRKKSNAEVPPGDKKTAADSNARNPSTSSAASSSVSPARKATRITKPRVMFTKIDSAPYKKLVAKLGGQIVDIPELATILVTDQVYRTYKFLCALAKGIPIVSDDWIKATATQMDFADPEQYIIKDRTKEKKFKFSVQKTLTMARKQLLLKDYSVFITSSTKPPPDELSQIIQCAGGNAFLKYNEHVENTEKMFLVADETDKKEITKYKSHYPKLKSMSTEDFMMTIMQQEFHNSN